MKSVVVTGGSKGLGLTIVREILEKTDYKCVVISRSSSLELDELLKENERIDFLSADLGDPSSIYDISQKIISKCTCGIWGLVNNAAIGGDGILATQHVNDISDIINLNQIAPILLSKYIGRQLIRKRAGHIINISSVVSKTGYSGLSVYASTKASLLGFSKSLAREYGKYGVCVNSILPGFMATDMTADIGLEKLNKIAKRSPTKSLASTEAVASIVINILLTTDFSINGTEFVIDAGNSA